MRHTLARSILLGAPLAVILALAGQAGGPERTIIRTATVDGVIGPVYYSSVDRRYRAVGTQAEELAGLDTSASAPR